jgi:hypothetical protein
MARTAVGAAAALWVVTACFLVVARPVRSATCPPPSFSTVENFNLTRRARTASLRASRRRCAY